MLHKNRIELHNSHIIVNKIHIRDLVTEVCRYLAFFQGSTLSGTDKKKSCNISITGSFLCELFILAEKEGFEPPEPRSSTVFKTAAIDHSAISPVLFFKSSAKLDIFLNYTSRFFNLFIKNLFFVFQFHSFQYLRMLNML